FNAITGICNLSGGSVLFHDQDLRRPFRRRTVVGIGLIALLTAAMLVTLINVEELWDAAITANYVYQQPFPWFKAVSDLFASIPHFPASPTLLTYRICFVV